MKINEKTLKETIGGFSFNASWLNALARGITTILELGRSIGTAIRRSTTGNFCKL